MTDKIEATASAALSAGMSWPEAIATVGVAAAVAAVLIAIFKD